MKTILTQYAKKSRKNKIEAMDFTYIVATKPRILPMSAHSTTSQEELLLRNMGFTQYKLRSEAQPDFTEALRLWKMDGHSIQRAEVIPQFLVFQGQSFPISDGVATFYSNSTKEELIASLEKGVDLHVMYETLESIENYTGVRKRKSKK